MVHGLVELSASCLAQNVPAEQLHSRVASRTPAAAPPGDFPTDAALRAFSRQLPAEQRRFDDRRLLAYRHPQELPSLAVALAVVLLGLGLVVRWSWAAGVAL